MRGAALLVAALLMGMAAAAWAASARAGDSGMDLRDVSSTLPDAVTVVGTAPGGAAAAAGLRAGDRVVTWKTWPVRDPAAPFRRPHELRAGDPVRLTVQRLVQEPPAGVAGFDRYRPEETVVLRLRPALARGWPSLLAVTASVVAALAAAVLVVARPHSRPAATGLSLAAGIALTALAAPLAEAALRVPDLSWPLGAGWAIAAVASVAALLAPHPRRGAAPGQETLGHHTWLRRAAVAGVVAYAVVVGIGAARVAGAGDDGVRVRPVAGQGLAITRTLPGSPAALAGIGAGRWIVGVDGLVTRDARQLWVALTTRPAHALGRLQLQGSVRTGTGTGLGGSWDGHVQLRPRLATPLVATGIAAVALAGLAALAAAATAVSRASRRTASPDDEFGSLLGLACCAALLASARVWAEAGHTSQELVPVVGSGTGLVVLLLWRCLRRVGRRPAAGLWLSAGAAALVAAAEPVTTATASEVRGDVAELLSFAGAAAPALVAALVAATAPSHRYRRQQRPASTGAGYAAQVGHPIQID